MTEKLQQTIKEELAKLPKETQDVISSLDWIKITKEISEKYLLDEDGTTNFQLETMLVLFGIESSDLYEDNIQYNVILSKEKTEQIVKETYEKIFKPINDKIEENIKKDLQNKKLYPEQNLDFILSGGDYSAFITNPPRLGEERVGGGDSAGVIRTPSLADIKAKLLLDKEQ